MDTFMDKLAQKLTAQEMIKANTAADAEEMRRLKSQVKEYREILDQMQKLVGDSLAKINQIQVEAQDDEKVQEALNQLKQSVEMSLNGVSEDWNALEQTINAKLNHTNESISQLESVLGEKIDSANESVNQIEQSVSAKLESASENIHKECVKVYRNVQAVVVEENNKQTESIATAVNALKGKMGAVLGVSIVALIAAVGGIAFQVLVYLQVI